MLTDAYYVRMYIHTMYSVCAFISSLYNLQRTMYAHTPVYNRNDCLMVMLKYLNELSFYYLVAGTQENAQVIHINTCT